eukprot:1948745-Prymnesium_polylepis.1
MLRRDPWFRSCRFVLRPDHVDPCRLLKHRRHQDTTVVTLAACAFEYGFNYLTVHRCALSVVCGVPSGLGTALVESVPCRGALRRLLLASLSLTL